MMNKQYEKQMLNQARISSFSVTKGQKELIDKAKSFSHTLGVPDPVDLRDAQELAIISKLISKYLERKKK